MKISKDIHIESLIERIPESVNYLAQKGIHCIACGEPVWGTLEELVQQKGLRDSEIDELINEIEKL